jgi:predicted ester cyclase
MLPHLPRAMVVPPTGRPITITGLAMHRIENGKIKEGWNNWDALGLLQQVGALSTK